MKGRRDSRRICLARRLSDRQHLMDHAQALAKGTGSCSSRSRRSRESAFAARRQLEKPELAVTAVFVSDRAASLGPSFPLPSWTASCCKSRTWAASPVIE